MYAVIFNKNLLYLGNNKEKVSLISKKNKSSIVYSEITLEKLSELLGFSEKTDEISTIEILFEKLENLNLKEFDFKDNNKKTIKANFVGIKGMEAVGKDFVSITDVNPS
jgi:hypothetical protein